MQQDYGQLYTGTRRPASVPWEMPEETLEYYQRLPFTVFNQEYLTVTIDEAQGLRNLGTKHSSALGILMQGEIRLILTATPLQTSTKVCGAQAYSFNPQTYRV